MAVKMVRLKGTGIWVEENLGHYIEEKNNEKGELVGLILNFGVHRKEVTDLDDIAIVIDHFGLEDEGVKIATPEQTEPEASPAKKLLQSGSKKK